MATTMEGSFTVPADRATVWEKLNDPEVLKACIAGCQTLEKTSDTTFVATTKMKIGPVSASFKGKVEPQASTRQTGAASSGKAKGASRASPRGRRT